MLDFLLFIGSLLLVVQSADLALHYSSRLAQSLRISRHLVGFLIIAGISILPETFIAINSAMQGIPSFGLGTLFGSNVADLTLVFALVSFFAFKNIKIQSSILKINVLFVAIISLPILFGLNGFYSRFEGLMMIAVGFIFYFVVMRKAPKGFSGPVYKFSISTLLLLIFSMCLLLLGAYLTVKHAVLLSNVLQVNPVLVGMFVVGLGTVLPELIFSIKAVRHNHTALALGDVLGTVISDATIVVGILALISPFYFNVKIIYITGFFMVMAALFLFYLMKTDKMITKKEGLLLVAFYLSYATVEFLMN